MSWLFEAIPEEERVRIDSALASCGSLSLHAGSSVEPSRFNAASLVAVEQGLVFVSAVRGTRRRMIIALGGSASLLLPPAPHERLETLADSRLTLVTEGAQRALLGIPAAAVVITEGLAVRLRDCQESLSHFSNARHVDRVRQKLTQLAGAYGKVGGEGVWLSLPLTHEALAGMVGSTRETVTRAMAQLMREGFVHHERGAYRLAIRREMSRA